MKAKAARERGRSVRRRISLDVKDCVEMVVEERREAVRWLLWWLGMVVVREKEDVLGVISRGEAERLFTSTASWQLSHRENYNYNFWWERLCL
jgi:hypothetical protein